MRRMLITLPVMVLLSLAGFSQQYITKGKIEYERKTNQHAFLDENDPWDAQAKRTLPKFLTYYFDLTFDNDKTLYRAGKDADVKQSKYWGVFEADNIIATDLNNGTAVNQKTIFNNTFLLLDSIRKIEWKLSPEVRKIAGFDCRKAVGKVLDSVIVIAFYSEEIVPAGGPETFAGLPGMILGIAIPKMHTTWYATKLELAPVTDAQLATPTRGKKLAPHEFKTQLKDLLKNWGEEGRRIEWQVLL